MIVDASYITRKVRGRCGAPGKVAEAEGVALNQLINVALAEKLSALRRESYFEERAKRADVEKAISILKKAGAGNPVLPDDEI